MDAEGTAIYAGAGQSRRGPLAASAFSIGCLAILALTVFADARPQYVGPVVAFLVLGIVTWRRLLAWRSLLTATILLIFFIPIKRYAIPSALPFELEPYRIFIAFAAAGWAASLLVDPRVRARRSGIETPLLLFAVAIAVSLLVNPGRVGSVSSEVNKSLIFFASFFVVFYLTVSTVRRLRDVDYVVTWLVASGAVLAVFALIERRTNYNVFNHLDSFLPLELNRLGVPDLDTRGGRLRVAASAQHPIALGSAFALLIPLAVYVARTRKKFYWSVATMLILLGALATGSRTAVVMLLVIAIVFLWLRPRETRRLWPAVVPMLLVIHFAAPGALGTVKSSFFPKGGLVAEQQDAGIGHARLTTLGPTLRNEWEPHALFGEGWATRVTTGTEAVPIPNAPILDDQWLGVLVETGLFGALMFGWMFVRFIRRAGGAARKDRSQRGWLLTATVASVTSYAVGMFTYDSFSFIQVSFLLFIILGLACCAWQAPPEGEEEGAALDPAARRPPRGLQPATPAIAGVAAAVARGK